MSGWENLVDNDTAQLLDDTDEPEEEYANEFRYLFEQSPKSTLVQQILILYWKRVLSTNLLSRKSAINFATATICPFH